MNVSKAFSDDGFLVDQRYTESYPYGRFSSALNGCGWIAAYNLLHALGRPVDCAAVNRMLNVMLPWKGCFGTPVRTMRLFLSGQHVPVRKVTGRKRFLAALPGCYAGIIRYLDGYEPHYVAFYRLDADTFRFLNAREGEQHHCTDMETFLHEQVHFPYFRVLLTSFDPRSAGQEEAQ